MALRTRSEVLRQATDNYLSQYTRNTLPKPAVIQNELLDATRNEIEIENAGLPKGSKYPAPRDLEPAQIADILCVRFEIRNIFPCGHSRGCFRGLHGRRPASRNI